MAVYTPCVRVFIAMKFDQTSHVHRLVLWTYMHHPVPAPFHLVLHAWLREPTQLMECLQKIMRRTHPRVGTCQCCDGVNALNAFLDVAYHSATTLFLHVPAAFVTPLPLELVDTYISALNNRHIVSSLIQRCDASTDVTACRSLSQDIARCGGADYEDVILNSGLWSEEIKQLHRFMLNCIFKRTHVVVIIFVTRSGDISMKELNVVTNTHGLQCNCMDDCGERCTALATLRCGRCRRAFYCTRACQVKDVAHVYECDTPACTHRRRKRSHGSRTRSATYSAAP